MRILYVVHQFLPRYFTGTEQHTWAIANAAKRAGHEVHVFTLEPDFGERSPLFSVSTDELEGIPITRVRFWMHVDRDFERMEYRHPLVAERFRRLLESVRPDLVHIAHLRYLGVGPLEESKQLGIPVVVHLHDFWFLCPAVTLRRHDGSLCDGPPEGGLGCIDCVRADVGRELDRNGLREAMRRTSSTLPVDSTPSRTARGRAATLLERPRVLREALLRADRIVSPSRFLKGVFAANGFPPERIAVLGFGLDPAHFAALVPEPRAAGAPLRVGHLGSIAEYKGTDLVVDAVAGAAVPMTLSVFGRVEEHDPWAKALHARAQALPNVRFEGSFARHELARVLGRLDVVVVPSRWYENAPFVVLEAQTAKVPVFASDHGGLSERIRQEHDGELFRPGDLADLRARLERLAREPERLARYRGNQPRIQSLDEHGAEILSIYAELAGATASEKRP
ncbi:MAG: glycosyltransferase [Planctomycetes bacterium]|nr:glycosyltransferase [Planctomycetota bacterium]